MTNNNISKNYVLNLSYQIFTLLVPFITTPYISRTLGAAGIGTYSYTYSIVTYFTLIAALGTLTYAQREIAYVQQFPKKFSKIFWEIVILRTIMTGICCVFYLIYIQQIGDKRIGLIQGIYLVGVATDISWFFQGMEKFSKIIFRSTLIKFVNIIFILIFVNNSDDLEIYLFGMAFLPVIGNILLWFYLPKYLVKIKLEYLRPFKHLKNTFQLFIPTVAIQIYTVLDKTMIGIFTGSSEQNGYYEQSVNLVRMCLTLITSLGTVMMPRISSTFASGNYNMLKVYMKQTYQFVWFLSLPLFGGITITASTFIPWFLGNEFHDVIQLIQIFSFLIIAIGLNNVTGIQYLIPTKKHNIFTITVIIGALTNFLLNLTLIPSYGAKGAAFASVVAETIITITQFIYVVSISKNFTWDDIFENCWKYMVSSGIMFLCLANIKMYLPNTIWSTLLLVITGGSIYLLTLLFLKDSFLTGIIRKIFSKEREN